MEQIGRYKIVGELGRGAMGIVFKAQDPTIGRMIAIKSIRWGELTDESERERLRERLFREAQSAGILSHPNIVTIYDIADEGEMAYIFMELVNGPSLERMLKAERAPDKGTLLSLLRQTALALDYAHKRGIVHRDVKPANIMVHEDGTAKITDFGIAKIVSQNMTRAGTIMGTPSYMSPEQIQGTEITGRADQFSLAVIAYEILTGEKPFNAEYLPTLLYKIVREAPAPPHRLNSTLAPEVEPVLRRALSKNPDERFETCTDFISALATASANSLWVPLPRGAASSLPTAGSGDKITAPSVELYGETVAARPEEIISLSPPKAKESTAANLAERAMEPPEPQKPQGSETESAEPSPAEITAGETTAHKSAAEETTAQEAGAQETAAQKTAAQERPARETTAHKMTASEATAAEKPAAADAAETQAPDPVVWKRTAPVAKPEFAAEPVSSPKPGGAPKPDSAPNPGIGGRPAVAPGAAVKSPATSVPPGIVLPAARVPRSRQEPPPGHGLRNAFFGLIVALALAAGVLYFMRGSLPVVGSWPGLATSQQAAPPPPDAATPQQQNPAASPAPPPPADAAQTSPSNTAAAPNDAPGGNSAANSANSSVSGAATGASAAAPRGTASQVPAAGAPATTMAFQLTTTPAGAQATVDGAQELRCTSPCSLNLPLGRHTIQIHHDGFRDVQRVFNLPDDPGLIVTLSAATGVVSLTSMPAGLAIIVDGKEQARKTPASLLLPVGAHKITIVKDGQKQEFTIDVRDGVVVERSIDWTN